MSLDDLANLGEIVGGVGVVLSLIYVGFQLRHNTRSQQASSYGQSLDHMAAIQQMLAGNVRLGAVFNRGLFAPESLTVADRVRFVWVLTELFGALEFMHQQYLDGHMPKEIWQRWSATLRWWMSFTGVRRWWQAKPTEFSREFSELVDQSPSEPTACNPAWDAYLETGLVGRSEDLAVPVHSLETVCQEWGQAG